MKKHRAVEISECVTSERVNINKNLSYSHSDIDDSYSRSDIDC